METDPRNTTDTTTTPAQTSDDAEKAKPLSKLAALRKERFNWRRRFLRALKRTGSVTKACRYSGKTSAAAYKARQRLPVFARKWAEAEAAYHDKLADSLEAEAIRRGRDGVTKDVYHKGKIVGQEQRYSDALLIKALIAYRPERWAPKDEKGDTTVNVGVQVNQELPEGGGVALTAADLEAARQLMRQANPEPEALPPADPQTGT